MPTKVKPKPGLVMYEHDLRSFSCQCNGGVKMNLNRTSINSKKLGRVKFLKRANKYLVTAKINASPSVINHERSKL